MEIHFEIHTSGQLISDGCTFSFLFMIWSGGLCV